MKNINLRLDVLMLSFLALSYASVARADAASAELAMEDPLNPLLEISTSQGSIYIELFPNEAPGNVANFIALAEGEIELVDPATNTGFRPRYFNGMRFHRVVPNFVIQAGSPSYNPLGAPAEILRDEINADYLGLDQEPVLNPDASLNSLLNIENKPDFEKKILAPLYRSMGIETESELLDQQNDVLATLQQMSVKNAYENLGYRFRDEHPSRRVSRGVMALANAGPDSNGPEFFISLVDAAWLTGKHTVIGKVVEGMDVVDNIGNLPVNPLRFSRLSTVIYSIRRLN